ncbi:MAG: MATE family efflux transporter [Paracoccus sp. (in: a-proteobacteria)]|uniref:MATE family efflux transporter n=1 Tax=Paracoccus sp. TaxID=267 RepID=UPI0026DFAE50|nr:MATE family efflux transporter [Paracoccus sp. (in: a-proteobacteria)]MDO5630750.1 MATE family efflux transporter [Paracoccus sp. (in: a-proteobacteria)]
MAEIAGPPLTHRRVLAIALPIVVSNATVPLLGLVDTGVIGQLGQAAPIGAVGLGAVILTTFYWVFGFLRMGTTGLIAQSHGAGAAAETGAHLARALAIGLGAGLAFILLQMPLFWAVFRIAPASPEVEVLARDYLAIRIWGAPATIALYAITGWLIAVERTRAVLGLQLLQNGLNVVLDLWFVLGLGYGVGGVAAATLIAEWSGLLLGLWLARPMLRGVVSRGLFAASHMARLMQVNGNIMIRSVLLQISFTSFMFLSAGQGELALATNQVLLQFLAITAYALDGFAFAAESLVGQAVGARQPGRVRRASVITAQWGAGGALMLSGVFLLAGPWTIDLLTTAPDVRQSARAFLPWLAIAPLIGVGSWMLDGIFIGATLTREMRAAMVQSVAVYALALILLPAVFGHHGLWAALMVLNLTRALTMARYYPRAEAAASGMRVNL